MIFLLLRCCCCCCCACIRRDNFKQWYCVPYKWMGLKNQHVFVWDVVKLLNLFFSMKITFFFAFFRFTLWKEFMAFDFVLFDANFVCAAWSGSNGARLSKTNKKPTIHTQIYWLFVQKALCSFIAERRNIANWPVKNHCNKVRKKADLPVGELSYLMG